MSVSLQLVTPTRDDRIWVGRMGLYGWIKGNQHGTEKLNKYIGEQAIEAVRIAKGRETVTTEVVTKYVAVRGKTELVTRTVEKEVVRYAETNPGFCLDPTWRVLHDAAAANHVPDPRLKPDAASGAPKAAEALETVTGNYSACHRTADRLDALQDWVKKQQAVR
jgi:hypothetical protein